MGAPQPAGTGEVGRRRKRRSRSHQAPFPAEALAGGVPARGTVASAVADRVRDLILEGVLPPGTSLHLTFLARRLDVSATPVRDALRILETEGLVLAPPRRTAKVAPLSIEDAEEIYAARAGLEALAARRGAERLMPEHIEELRALYQDMEAAARDDDLARFVECDQAFHYYLYSLSGRERLLRSISLLRARSRRYVPYIHRALQDFPTRLAVHRPILEAVDAGDIDEVERLTREHLSVDPKLIVTALASGGSPSLKSSTR